MIGKCAAALLALASLAAPNIAVAGFDDRHLTTDGPWTLYATFQDGKFSWCAAEQWAGSERMRLIQFGTEATSMIATPTRKTKAFDGGIAVNGHGDGVEWSTFNGWAIYTARAGYLVDDLSEGRKLQIDVGSGFVTYSLDRVESVLGRLKTCAMRKGN